MPSRKRVFFVSDRTGITVEALGSSLLTQFADLECLRLTLPFIDSVEKAREVVAQINEAHRDSGQRPLVFSSIVDDAVRTEINKADGLVLDVFERFIVPLENELGKKNVLAEFESVCNAARQLPCGWSRRRSSPSSNCWPPDRKLQLRRESPAPRRRLYRH